jgi:glycine cleavage system aminomethyltransferase T
MTQPVYRLALRDTYSAAGGIFATAHGWSLPTHFGDAAQEYVALRERAVLFDRSHHSRFVVSGTDAGVVLAAVFGAAAGEIEEGRALRAVALDNGIIDDLALVSRTGGISYVVIGEPERRLATLGRLNLAIESDFDARVEDRTESTCLLALAGPEAAAVAARHLGEGLPSRVRFLQNTAFEAHGFRALAIRASDTGDDGFLLMLAPAVAQHLVEELAGEAPLAGEVVFGIGRVEACVPAFDPDLSTGLSPAEADLDALLDVPGGSRRWLLSAVLVDGDEPAQPGTPIRSGENGAGEIRSCVFSPGLRATIGLALLQPAFATPGNQLSLPGRELTVAAKPLHRKRA